MNYLHNEAKEGKKKKKRKGEPNKSHVLLYSREWERTANLKALLYNLLCVWNKYKNKMGNTPIRTAVWKKKKGDTNTELSGCFRIIKLQKNSATYLQSKSRENWSTF